MQGNALIPVLFSNPPVTWVPAGRNVIQVFLAEHKGVLSRCVLTGSGVLDESGVDAWPAHRLAGLVTRRDADARSPFAVGSLASGDASARQARFWLACACLPGEPKAFALWDTMLQALLVVRDRMGCLPLCVAADARVGILVAARAETIADVLGQLAKIDSGRIADVLVGCLQWLDPGATFYHPIRRVPAGSWALISVSGMRVEPYWRPRPAIHHGLRSDMDFALALRDVLSGAVEACRPNSADDWGAMLSGGMDSATMAALAADSNRRRARGPLRTFSVLDSGAVDCRESATIHSAYALSGIDPITLDLASLGEDRDWLQRALFDVDEPWDASLSMLRWIYSAAGRRQIVHVIDGIDADSLLVASDPVGELSRQIRRFQWISAVGNARGLRAYWGAGSAFGDLLTALWRAAIPGRLLGLLAGRRPAKSAQERLADLVSSSPIHPDFARRINLLDRQERYDRETSEQGCFDMRTPVIGIERYHRAAAPHGVAPIHPFLDSKVVEFCLGLPQSQLFANGWPKYVLRKAMEHRIPDAVRWRRGKEHLGWTLTRTLATGLDPPLHIRLRKLREVLEAYVKPEFLARLIIEPVHTEEDVGWSVDLVALGEWLRRRAHLI